ncbi:MAG: hypothetical protein ACE5DX_05915 [Candidatus Dojkabacteria bacterium]
MRIVAGAIVYFVIVVAVVFFGYQFLFSQPSKDDESNKSTLDSTAIFVLSEVQQPISVGGKERQTWQTISQVFEGQPGQVIGVLYKQTKATENGDSNLAIRRVDNSEFANDLPGLWPDNIEQFNGEPVCAVATGNYDEFRMGEDICNDFFSEFMNQSSDKVPIAVNLPVGQKISTGEQFRLTWQRGWGDGTTDAFTISELQFVYYNP